MLYDFLVIAHVFSAIVGLGPGFALVAIIKTAKTWPELQQAYYIKNRVHIFVMIGGMLLIATGLAMGFLRPYLFAQLWFSISLTLYSIILIIAPFILRINFKPIKVMLAEYEGNQIPEEYYQLERRLIASERLMNFCFLFIILLMILKPF